MKLVKFFPLLFILILIPAVSFSSSFEFLHISLIDGDVQIRTEDTEEWVPASINMPLKDGDRIWVPEEGKLELRSREGTYLRLDERSALEILTLDKDSFQFHLTEGYAYVNFSGQRGSFLQMDTPVSSIRAYDRSIFKVDLPEGGLNHISVLKGSVDVESRSGRTTVKSGDTLTLDDETYAELSPLGPPDEWERWNSERDRKLTERRPPPSYLPEELYGYTSDFETYGRWIYVRGYGYVWRPTLAVSIGWAPYRIGRWVWMRGDYVWVSHEPWGWAPYHYGRWAFVASFGWCWVPPVRGAVFWGPGFVAWVRTPTYVAWVPLGPREIYYGYGHYGPYSVNITNVNITGIQVNNRAYRNINVQNAVTVVHHDTFVRGRQVDVNIRENPFQKERINVGRPDIKPERTTAMPVVREVPQAKRPPEPIREIRVKELQEKRPLVKERNVSVLRPESPPREMTPAVKEGRPFERDLDKAKAPPSPKPQMDKSREAKPPHPRPPVVHTEKPKGAEATKEMSPPEKTIEKRPDSKQDTKGVEKPREVRSQDRTIEKTVPAERKIERPQEPKSQSKVPEKGIERPKEVKTPERVIERPRETKPPEREVEKSKESRVPERGVERTREIKPSEGVGRTRETVPQERGVERPRELQQPQRQIQEPRQTAPEQRGVETHRELRQPEREIQAPSESSPQRDGIERSRPSEGGKAMPGEPRSNERRQNGPRVFK